MAKKVYTNAEKISYFKRRIAELEGQDPNETVYHNSRTGEVLNQQEKKRFSYTEDLEQMRKELAELKDLIKQRIS